MIGDEFLHAVARIPISSTDWGTGFLITENVVLTALHVVAKRTDPPQWFRSKFDLHFPGLSKPVSAEPVANAWGVARDWVLLRCQPIDRSPIPVGLLAQSSTKWKTHGFPVAENTGMTIEGAIRQLLPNGLLQLHSPDAAAGKGMEVGGLSGAPCMVDGSVVGHLVEALVYQERTPMMVADRSEAGTLYARPIEDVLDEAAALAPALELPVPDPYRGLPSIARRPLPATLYRVLQQFSAADAEIFFGRGKEIRELYRRVVNETWAPIILLYGQSGAGKSSLFNAGLRPRLENTWDVLYRARGPGGLAATINDAFQEPEDADLNGAWRKREAISGKPILFVLDQLEECYTRSGGEPAREIAALGASLRAIFNSAEKPRGKLILGFRKEWLAEIRTQLAPFDLFFNEFFLQRMDRAGIIEAVRGPTLSDRLRAQYRLSIEDELPERIADDLLADPESPAATILQVIMNSFEEQTAGELGDRRFTIGRYQALHSRGLKLTDFLQRQFGLLSGSKDAWEVEVEASGLVLDVLFHHTTEHGTACTHTRDALLAAYSHRGEDIPRLVNRLKDLYLLADPLEVQQPGASRLAHDTLAPIVIAEYRRSQRPGQRARRILENRIADWERAG